MFKQNSCWVAALVACVVATTVGCSDLTAKVNGTVSLDGKKLTLKDGQRGTIVFRPVEGGPTTMAILEKEGTYTLNTGSKSSIKPGEYLVAFRLVEITESDEPGVAPTGKPLTPAVYADPLESGIRFTVTSGLNKCDVDLDSSRGPVMAIEPEPTAEQGDSESEEQDSDSADEASEANDGTAETPEQDSTEESSESSEGQPQADPAVETVDTSDEENKE